MRFEDWVAERTPILARTAVALCGDLGLAEDLVQEVLIKVHHQWPRIDALTARDSYVRRMLVNEFLSWRRKWSRVVVFESIEVERDQPEHSAVHADRQLLRREISALSRPQQVVLALRYYAGLSDAEIAEALECNLSTIRSHAARALAALRINPTLRSEYVAARINLEGEHAK